MSLTLAHFDQKHRELMDKIFSLENGISALRKENSDLKQENSVLKSEVINLKKSCLQAELVSKRQNIILHGIPIVQGVDPETAARKLFTEIGVANAIRYRLLSAIDSMQISNLVLTLEQPNLRANRGQFSCH